MAAVMPILAIALLALGWVAIVPKGDLTLLEDQNTSNCSDQQDEPPNLRTSRKLRAPS
jgi:hypothetical protein